LAVAVAASGAAGTGRAAAQESPPAVPEHGRYVEQVFDDVTITRNIPFRETVNSRGLPVTLRLDMYEPAGDTAEKRPVYLLMSGGFLNFVNKTQLLGAGEGFARAGYVVVSIEYRTRPEMDMTRFPAVIPPELTDASLDAYDDARAAVDWLRDHAEQYRLDPQAIIAAGGSAGGSIAWHLAWLAGTDVRPEPANVAAAVPLSAAPLDIAVPGPDSPPVLAFHGTADSVIPFAWARDACDRAAEQGASCELVAYEGGGHPIVQPTIDIVARHGDDIGKRTWAFLAREVLAPLGYFGPAEPEAPPTPENPATPESPESPAGPATPAVPAAPVGPTALPLAPAASAVAGTPTFVG
jgi:acetyl esterase/lipase